MFSLSIPFFVYIVRLSNTSREMKFKEITLLAFIFGSTIACTEHDKNGKELNTTTSGDVRIAADVVVFNSYYINVTFEINST